MVLVNPVVTPLGDEREDGWEGCLSIPDLRGLVPRLKRLKLDALDRHGKPYSLEASDFFARVIQHECDHLDGDLYVDRMKDMRSADLHQGVRGPRPQGRGVVPVGSRGGVDVRGGCHRNGPFCYRSCSRQGARDGQEEVCLEGPRPS